MKRRLTLAIFFFFLLTIACPAQTVTLIGFDKFDRKKVTALAQRLRSVAGVKVKTNANIPMPNSSYDATRRQHSGSAITDLLEQKPHLKGKIVIALTSEDLYMPSKPEWRYCFSTYGGDRRQMAVFSDFRMNPSNYGAPANPQLTQERLEKMVLSYVGRFVLGKPSGKDRSSLLFQPVLGPDDLDKMEFRY